MVVRGYLVLPPSPYPQGQLFYFFFFVPLGKSRRHLAVIDIMKTSDSPGGQEPSEYATPDEVEGALNALAADDYKFLYYTARQLSLDSMSPVRDADLLHEAVFRTLKGAKRWRHGVSIRNHLVAAMRNIAGHSAKRARIVEFRSPTPDSEDGDETQPLSIEEIAVTHLTPRDMASTKDSIATLKEAFIDDVEAWDVLQLRSEGHQKEDIIEIMHISPEKYGAIKKRIQRKKSTTTALLYHENPTSPSLGAPNAPPY